MKMTKRPVQQNDLPSIS